MEYLMAIVFSLLITLVEPMIFFPIGVSIFLIIWGVISSKKYSTPNIIFLVLGSIFLDVTLKYTLGSHLLACLVLTFLTTYLANIIPDSGSLIRFLKLTLSLVISLILLEYLKDFAFEVIYIGNIFLSSIISAVAIIIVDSFVSMFKSESNISNLTIK